LLSLVFFWYDTLLKVKNPVLLRARYY